MINQELIQSYMNRFINRTDIFGRQWQNSDGTQARYSQQSPDMQLHSWQQPYEPVTPGLLRRFLCGFISCAWSATDENNCSKWLCFDSDTDDCSLDRLEAFLRSQNLHILREGRRPGRAGHLWMLISSPVPTDRLIRFAEGSIKRSGARDLEIFPKTANGYSQVRGPLGINLKPEANRARGWFDEPPRDVVEQLEWLACQPVNQAANVIKVSEEYSVNDSPSRKIIQAPKSSETLQYGKFKILKYLQVRRQGSGYIAQCPLCAAEGHDRHHDNLYIKNDGVTFLCVFGGPGQIHKKGDIMRAVLANFISSRRGGMVS